MNTTNTTNTAAASFVITKHYAKRDPEAQGDHYINHVSAMTGEGLHAKSDIAAELAHRDIEIDRLRAALAAPAQAVPASVITASVMRDDGGEQPAFCLMVAYRTEKDAMAALAMLADVPTPDQTGEYPELPERTAFEGWIKKDSGDLRTFGSGQNTHYCNSAVNNAWSGWQASAARGAAQAVASIYISEGGDREFDDWRVHLPVGTNVLYTRPTTPAQAAPVDAEPLWRTDAEIVEQTEILARYLLSWKWGLQPESPDAQLRNSQSTKAQKAWNAACEIQDLLTATDVENAVAEVDDAARAAQGVK